MKKLIDWKAQPTPDHKTKITHYYDDGTEEVTIRDFISEYYERERKEGLSKKQSQ